MLLPVDTRSETVGNQVKRQLGDANSWLTVALFALLAGIAFVATLNAFLDQSSQALSAPPPEPINLNQLLIRPFVLWVGAAALVVLPLATARANATFAGTLALYAVMLLAPLALVGVLLLFGAPEWGPVVTGFVGLLLMGAAFISAALFISSLATSAIAAGFATFAVSLVLVAAAWLARTGTPGAQPVFRPVSVGESLDDFAKGVVDTGHVVSCLTITALGLVLTRLIADPRQPTTDNRQLTTDN